MIKAIIFDCFGVLLTDALEALVAEFRDTETTKADHIVSVITAASKGIISADVSRLEVSKTLGITSDEYVQLLQRGEVKNRELLAYIKQLKKTYKLGLLSNVSAHGLATRFSADELATHFDAVVASGDIGYAKPDAQAYEITASKLGVRLEECIMIDDRNDYTAGAVSVGMSAIQYVSFRQVKSELDKFLASPS